MSEASFQSLSPTSVPQPSLIGRIQRMATAWAALGAFMGASLGMEAGGVIGAIATMIAGAAELAVLGAIFALIGGRPRESILGAVGGLLVGLAAGVRGGHTSLAL